MTHPPVLLASASPRRRELLTMVGIAHEVIPADIDEAYVPGEVPSAHAQRLAEEKAALVAARNPAAIVVGADTIVVVDGVVLGKPASRADAGRMLRALSGRSHVVYTAVAVRRGESAASAIEAVDVTFRHLSDEEIAAYIDTGEPMDKAGAYGIQGFGAMIVERIDGDFFAVMGLPLGRMVRLMETIGARYDFLRGVLDVPAR
ncbi:MAG TPA: Maf family protein [Gemmatimonadaceae bacterium]|nr:Maf family protein [Gemmatimonadaceae bacterium]